MRLESVSRQHELHFQISSEVRDGFDAIRLQNVNWILTEV